MIGARVLLRRTAVIFLLVVIWASFSSAYSSQLSMCPKVSVKDSIFGFHAQICPLDSGDDSPRFIGVTEGNDVLLLKALAAINKNSQGYVAVLFYASWCPFSRNFRPTFSLIASLYPSIHHIAIEESSIRSSFKRLSVLSNYGVRGFPTLLLINSTKRARYRGSRTLPSLVHFYTDNSGIKAAPLDSGSIEKIVLPSEHDLYEAKTSPLAWARVLEDKYLALAAAFLLGRTVAILFSPLLGFLQFAWLMCVQKLTLQSLSDRPLAYLNGVIHVFNSLKDPWRKRINARAWASKSLLVTATEN